MQLFIKDMSEDFAEQILKWKYEQPYDFYNNEVSDEGIKELMENSYSVILDQNEKLVGFFCVGKAAQVPAGSQFGAYPEDFIDIGLGMNPELTGRGFGAAFFSFILSYIQETYNDLPLRLTVWKLNLRAIHLYEKLGFVQEMEFNKGTATFIIMIKK
jgi:[ribosomal protein S18]-alanine N-acetyltransferase